RIIVLPDGRRVDGSRFVGPARRGPSVAYALDTTPCQDAVELSRDADVLVHESTYENARAELARSRAHSPGAEAARSGAEPRAGTKKVPCALPRSSTYQPAPSRTNCKWRVSIRGEFTQTVH